MTKTTVKLPEPPEFPASFASYSNTAGKMHKAAMNATTAAAAISAVSAISAHVKGVNTYAKKVRKYGEELVTAISTADEQANGDAEAPAARGPVTHGEAMTALGKREMAIPLKAGVIVSPPEGGKTFANKSNAKRSLKSAQLDHMPVEWHPALGGQVRPVLIGDTPKSLEYATERGFDAKLAK